ncbi:cupin domain-containing protein [Rhizobium sp. BR 362]|uniref:cupin domain-containing protein n=1 Tax=Rhizobium sp. BR 362 TaxID=3040670 RepID=UPI002F42D830
MSALQADTYYLFGNLLRFHAHSTDTGGAYCLVETLTAPGAGAPPNRHPDDDEAFYIVEGLFEFMVDGETVQAQAGSFVKIPTGAIHAFRNIGSTPGRLLIINSPGRVHDGFFTEAGEAMPVGTRDLPPPGGEPPDIARVVEIGRRNGLEFLLPDGEAH